MEKLWIQQWENHIKALQDLDNLINTGKTRKQAGAKRRLKNSYLKMYKYDSRITKSLYPSGFSN